MITIGVVTAINSAEPRPEGTSTTDGMVLWYSDTFTSNKHSVRTRSVLLVTQFILWRERMARIFRESSKEIHELVEEVVKQLKYTDMPVFHWICLSLIIFIAFTFFTLGFWLLFLLIFYGLAQLFWAWSIFFFYCGHDLHFFPYTEREKNLDICPS